MTTTLSIVDIHGHVLQTLAVKDVRFDGELDVGPGFDGPIVDWIPNQQIEFEIPLTDTWRRVFSYLMVRSRRLTVKRNKRRYGR